MCESLPEENWNIVYLLFPLSLLIILSFFIYWEQKPCVVLLFLFSSSMAFENHYQQHPSKIDKRNSPGWVVENLMSLFDH